MEALLRSTYATLIPAANASTLLFVINACLLRYVFRFDSSSAGSPEALINSLPGASQVEAGKFDPTQDCARSFQNVMAKQDGPESTRSCGAVTIQLRCSTEPRTTLRPTLLDELGLFSAVNHMVRGPFARASRYISPPIVAQESTRPAAACPDDYSGGGSTGISHAGWLFSKTQTWGWETS